MVNIRPELFLQCKRGTYHILESSSTFGDLDHGVLVDFQAYSAIQNSQFGDDTHWLGDTTICAFTVPVARALTIQGISVAVEGEGTTVAGSSNLEKWTRPVTEK